PRRRASVGGRVGPMPPATERTEILHPVWRLSERRCSRSSKVARMRRSSRRAFVASAVLVLAACAGGGGSPATRADVEAQVRDELPQHLPHHGPPPLPRL